MEKDNIFRNNKGEDREIVSGEVLQVWKERDTRPG